jgi:hypothetical protein
MRTTVLCGKSEAIEELSASNAPRMTNTGALGPADWILEAAARPSI